MTAKTTAPRRMQTDEARTASNSHGNDTPHGIDALLSRLDRVRPAGDGKYTARCPAHEDKSPSLSVRETSDGTVLIHCFAGCHTKDVLTAVGLGWSALFPDNPERAAWMAATRQKIRLKPIDPMDLERRILQIAKADIQAGRALSTEDRARVELAVERLEAAR